MRRPETMPLALRIVLIVALALGCLAGWVIFREATMAPVNDFGIGPPDG